MAPSFLPASFMALISFFALIGATSAAMPRMQPKIETIANASTASISDIPPMAGPSLCNGPRNRFLRARSGVLSLKLIYTLQLPLSRPVDIS